VREAFLRNLSTEEADRAMDPALCFGQDDCHKRAVDWRARALAAESRTPPPEVLRAAERIGELAAKCEPGPWSTEGDGKPPDPSPIMVCQPPSPNSSLKWGHPVAHCYGRPHNTHNAAFIAECRTLAPLLAEWVKGGGR
jgi:hypothetical protein